MVDTQTPPSEETPLIEPASKHDSLADLSTLRGWGISALMSLLIFIQGKFEPEFLEETIR